MNLGGTYHGIPALPAELHPRRRRTGPDVGRHGHRRLCDLPAAGRRGPDSGRLAGHRRCDLRPADAERHERLARGALRHAGRNAGGPAHGPVPHPLRHPHHSLRHSDAVGPLLHQPAYHGLGHRHGNPGHPGHPRGQLPAAGLLPLCPGAEPAQSPAAAAGLRRGPHRPALLVLRHGAGLCPPRHRLQPQHGQGPGHQHGPLHRPRPHALQRPRSPLRRAHGPVPGQRYHRYGPRRHRHRPGRRHHRRGYLRQALPELRPQALRLRHRRDSLLRRHPGGAPPRP